MSFKDPSTLTCQRCGKKKVQHQHHVVYKQHVRDNGGDINDPDNALGCCYDCHAGHHQPGLDDDKRLKLTELRDENYQFATSLLGSGRAYEYLRRRYAGEDPRLDALLN